MPERFSAGSLVRVRSLDRPGHTRVPRYVRGHVGMVVEAEGDHPLPDDIVAGADTPRRGTVYAVRFAARELWGAGDHCVTVDLWDTYLDHVEEPA